MEMIGLDESSRRNPLEAVEQMASSNNWPFERPGDEEIAIVVRGKWTDYRVSFLWMREIEAIHLGCAFEARVPDRCSSEVQLLISLINAQLWVGHLDHWAEEGLVMYRHAVPLVEGMDISCRQLEVMLSGSLEACERYYPAFQFVLWAGDGAREALEAAMFETVGQA